MIYLLEDADEAFITCLKDCNVKGILHYVNEHKSELSSFTFEKFLAQLSHESLEKLWSHVNYMAIDQLDILCGGVILEAFEYCTVMQSACELILTALQLAYLTLELLHEIPEGLYSMAFRLNKFFLEIPDTYSELKNNIVRLFEKLWIRNVKNGEHFLLNMMLYLLKQSLRGKAWKVAFKRLWVHRNCLHHFINAEQMIEPKLFEILIKCLTSSRYLEYIKGCRFLSYVFCISPAVAKKLHFVIKSEILYKSLHYGQAYGDIYYKSWLQCHENQELRTTLEHCIQDFVQLSIYILPCNAITVSVLSELRQFLFAIHAERKNKDARKLLHVLYQPVLFQALKHSNAEIRVNATYLFLDAFPILSLEGMKIPLNGMSFRLQALFMKGLLFDKSPSVREMAALNICIMLNNKEKKLTEKLAETFFNVLIEDLDKNSRHTYPSSFIMDFVLIFIKNHLSPPLLKTILLKIKKLFHNVETAVRIIFCHALLAIKNSNAIEFCEIIPVEELLNCMENDVPAVSKLIADLLKDMYLFPFKNNNAAMLLEVTKLITKNEKASKIFFSFAEDFTSVEDAATFIVEVCKISWIHAELIIKKKDVKYDFKTYSDVLNGISESATSLDGMESTLLVNLLEIAATLISKFHSSFVKLENYQVLIHDLMQYVPSLLECYKPYAKDSKVWIHLCTICSYIPEHIFPSFSKVCFARLMMMTEINRNFENTTLLSCLCRRGKAGSLLELIKESFQIELLRTMPKRLKTSDQSYLTSAVQFEPLQAALYFKILIDSRAQEHGLFDLYHPEFKNFLDMMDILKDTIERIQTSLIDDRQMQFLAMVFPSVVKLSVHYLNSKLLSTDLLLHKNFVWCLEAFFLYKPPGITPVMANSSDKRKINCSKRKLDATDLWKNLALQICQDMFAVILCLTTTQGSNKFSAHCMNFLNMSVHPENGPDLMVSYLDVVLQMLEKKKWPKEQNDSLIENTNFLPQVFFNFIKNFIDNDVFERIPPPIKFDVKFKLQKLLTFRNHSIPNRKTIARELIAGLLQAVFLNIIPILMKVSNARELCLPGGILFLLSSFPGHVLLFKLFLQEVKDLIMHKKVLVTTAASVLVLKSLQIGGKKLKSVINEATAVLNVFKDKATGFLEHEDEGNNKILLIYLCSSIFDIDSLIQKRKPK